MEINDNRLTLPPNHYTLSNGFLSPAHGEVHIKYSDLLSVELVKRRSKKWLYAMLILGGVLVFAFDFARYVFPAGLAVLAVLAGAMGAAYFFSSRYFMEITSMKGTYLVAVQPDGETDRLISQLQKRINF